MDNESKGLHSIFIIILIFILYLSYFAIPPHGPVKNIHKISKKAQTIVPFDKRGIEKEPVVENLVEKVTDKAHEPSKVVSNVPKKIVIKTENKVVEQAKKAGKPGQIDIISMNNPGYEKHKKGIVLFTHKKHVENYSISCGSCHHDEAGKPLELTFHDTPESCIACHKGTQKPKGEKLGKKEKIAKYHFEALHANCIGCHKKYNIEKGDAKGKVPAPTSCTKCHPKK